MANLKLIIGNQNYSSWSLRPWLFLKHHEIEFELTKVALFTPEMEPQLAPFHSNNKVPVLTDDGDIIWDSLAILEYLAERHPQLKGWPEDTYDRAIARSMCAEMHSSFVDLRTDMPMNCRRFCKGYEYSAGTQQDIDRICALWRYARNNYGQFGPWLFGEFSIADCMFSPVVVRLLGYDVTLDPISEEYAHTVIESPAMQSWINDARNEPEVIKEAEVDWPE